MSFLEAVKSAIGKYVQFHGRARRSEFWYFMLLSAIADMLATSLDQAGGTTVTEAVIGVALFLPGITVGVRRLHDIGRSGWWMLIGVIPLLLLPWFCRDSERRTNIYGPSPKPVDSFHGYRQPNPV